MQRRGESCKDTTGRLIVGRGVGHPGHPRPEPWRGWSREWERGASEAEGTIRVLYGPTLDGVPETRSPRETVLVKRVSGRLGSGGHPETRLRRKSTPEGTRGTPLVEGTVGETRVG